MGCCLAQFHRGIGDIESSLIPLDVSVYIAELEAIATNVFWKLIMGQSERGFETSTSTLTIFCRTPYALSCGASGL